MLYQFLRFVVFIATKLYFKSSHIRNIEQVPTKGAMFLAANHPSTFLDPLMVAVWLRRPLYFLTNGGIFTNNFVKWLFRQLFMVPIYRKQDSDNPHEQVRQNEKSFAACYEMLYSGGALAIFPEGVSENERRLRKIKTGLARIALGAAAKYEWQLPIKIVCAGINYTQSQRFQSEVFVQYDTPILVNDYRAAYEKNPSVAVHQLTKDIEKRLAELIVITEDKEADELTHQLEILYSNELKEFLGLPEDDTEQIFTVAQYFADAISHFRKTQPQTAQEFSQKVKGYFQRLADNGLKDHHVANYQPNNFTQKAMIQFMALFLGFPLYLLGVIHNYLPYKLPSIIAKALTKDASYYPAMHFGLGIITFCFFYGAYTFIAFEYLEHFVQVSAAVILYVLIVGILGFFAYFYWNYSQDWAALRRLHNLPQKNDLLQLRNSLVEELKAWKVAYLKEIE
jgi:glycerol-3-phosphate O-acyltransferase/dihydroxyacetone phosphate acyltransferase